MTPKRASRRSLSLLPFSANPATAATTTIGVAKRAVAGSIVHAPPITTTTAKPSGASRLSSTLRPLTRSARRPQPRQTVSRTAGKINHASARLIGKSAAGRGASAKRYDLVARHEPLRAHRVRVVNLHQQLGTGVREVHALRAVRI